MIITNYVNYKRRHLDRNVVEWRGLNKQIEFCGLRFLSVH